jgi:alcohol dehydrogenase (cytochrome c)
MLTGTKHRITRAIAVYALLFSGFVGAQVTAARIEHAAEEPQNWLTYSATYDGQRYSGLTQITTRNVSQLAAQWVFQTPVTGKFESTPLIVDGVMYVTVANSNAYAIDARTGRPIWHYERVLPEKLRLCCGAVNRGFAIVGDRVFMATLDAHVVALDSKTGNVVWDTKAADYDKGYTFTVAPLIVRDKVIVGVSGGEYGIRGFIDAYDVRSGALVWRFYTIPGPGEPGHESWAGDSWAHGGTPAWVTGSYDPELNLLYWPTGNPAPSNNGADRVGDNLYSNSMLALDPDSGKLKWYFQFTPFDLHDWDATEVPVLFDAAIDGRKRKLLMQANRNGFFYVLDRTDGRFVLGRAFEKQTWAKGLDEKGRPVVLASATPTNGGVPVCPGAYGATNFMSPSYSPLSGLFYVTAREQCDVFSAASATYQPGRVYVGSNYVPVMTAKDRGFLTAIDPMTGETRWRFEYFAVSWAGVLSTAGGLVFPGDIAGNLIAFDAQTGKLLWHFPTGAGIFASPVTYALAGRQYVAIAAGNALIAFALAVQ